MAISYEACGGVIPADVYRTACIHSLEEALACCNRIGYPAMLKASWGGGGKGIRKVRGVHGIQKGFRVSIRVLGGLGLRLGSGLGVVGVPGMCAGG